jgi:sugar phosphate isomerase/epimerase
MGPERWGIAPPRARRAEGHAVIVACSTLCFGRHPLDEALRMIRDMRFAKADLAVHAVGPHLRPADVTADVGKVAQKLKAANVAFAAIHLDFDPPGADDPRDQLRAVCRLARLLAVPVLTVSAAASGSDAAEDVARLSDWVKVAEGEGLILTVETRTGTLTEDVPGTVELCKRVPGLGVTLDPSHYAAGPHAAGGFDALYPYVRHVRLRDSGPTPNQFQVRVGQGDIEYGKIIAHLARFKYERALTVDVRDVPDSPFPIEPEVRKLKFLLESLV